MGYVVERRQVDAQALLDSVQAYKHRHEITDPVLLVVHQDLFRNGNSFVFGLAANQWELVLSPRHGWGMPITGGRSAMMILLIVLQRKALMNRPSSGLLTC